MRRRYSPPTVGRSWIVRDLGRCEWWMKPAWYAALRELVFVFDWYDLRPWERAMDRCDRRRTTRGDWDALYSEERVRDSTLGMKLMPGTVGRLYGVSVFRSGEMA